ncbi:MAG: hypothetical protein MUE98_06060 [Rhodobacteraceae bacterium]|nr:hypothetical protein [Paracoccaceae bacterium]
MDPRPALLAVTAALGSAAPTICLADDFDLPPLVGGAAVAEVPLDVPVEGLAEGDTDDLPAEPAAGRLGNTTLSFELRGVQTKGLDGSSTAALRASAHWFGRVSPAEDVDLVFNLRARAAKIEGDAFSVEDNVRVDVQELALSWRLSPAVTVDLGRLNIRNGVAQGFNPTDWFKADSLVVTDSQDPGDRRRERLGTLVVGGTLTWGSTLIQAGYRPEVDADPGSFLSDMDVVGLGLDRTNPSDAFYLKVTPDLGGNLSLTGNVLVEDGRLGAGLELSAAVGQSLVVYGEAFVQDRRPIAALALSDGAGSAGFRDGVGAGDGFDWLPQVAIGASWSLPAALVGQQDVSLALEYHYNGAGLSGAQIDTLAAAAGADLGAAGAIRGFAAREQEPLAREQVFARFAWNDFMGDADLAAFGFYVPHDGSGLAQISVGVPLNDNAELSLRAFSTFGGRSTIYGANPTEATAQIALIYTF